MGCSTEAAPTCGFVASSYVRDEPVGRNHDEPFVARGVRRGFKADPAQLKKILEAQAQRAKE